jgi:arylsulfatase A-like enzyme
MPRPPDILWIVTTQWRAQAFRFAGDANARTPHLDKFAAEAENFVQAVTPHPFGPFARAALLTGVPSPANGVVDYYDPLPADARTIAHVLGERGYATAYFGKWHLGERDRKAPLVGEPHAKMVVPPERRGGFEFWEGFESGFLLNDPWLHGTRLPEPTQFKGYQSDVLCDRAAEWIGAQAGEGRRPWFCVVSLESPHPPYDAPAAGISKRDAQNLVLSPNVPLGGEPEQKARRELSGYYAHLEATDRAIGGLLESLERKDVAVVFTSTHGDMHGAHGLFRKGWPHEESVRVPLLVRPPRGRAGGAAPGRRMDLVSLLDLHGWTQRWADGAEMTVPMVAAQQISMPSIVALPHQCDRAWRGVRTRMRKLVLADGISRKRKPESTPWLYFDLEADPLELTNLADDPAHRVEMNALQTLIKLPPARLAK